MQTQYGVMTKNKAKQKNILFPVTYWKKEGRMVGKICYFKGKFYNLCIERSLYFTSFKHNYMNTNYNFDKK